MTLTQKGPRVVAVAATVEKSLKSVHESVDNGEEVEEDDTTSDSKKRERDIA